MISELAKVENIYRTALIKMKTTGTNINLYTLYSKPVVLNRQFYYVAL